MLYICTVLSYVCKVAAMRRRSAQRRVSADPARRRILLAALHVIAVEGLESVTHRRVAELAAVSLGSTTHHFASREDLLREAFRAYLAEAAAVIAELDSNSRRSRRAIREQLIEFACDLVDREFRDEQLVRAEYELLLFAARDPALADDYRAWEARLVASLAATLESGGAPRPIDAARTLVNLVRGFELERLLDPRLGSAVLRRRLVPILAGLLGSGP